MQTSEKRVSSGWNRPTGEQTKAKMKAKARGEGVGKVLVRGLVAGALVVAVGVAYLAFMNGGEKPKAGRVKIREATTAGVKKPTKVARAAGGETISVRQQGEGETTSVRQQGTVEPEEGETNATADAGKDAKPKDTRVFKNAMDQLLSMVTPREVGGDVPPLPITDNMKFTEAEEKQILERLTADEGDSDAALERKELVQSMRDEYQELKKRGWEFIDYIKALEAKAKLDTEVRDESRKLHDTVFNDPDISDEKYKETLEKINKVLTDRGIKPIVPPGSEPEEDASSTEEDQPTQEGNEK